MSPENEQKLFSTFPQLYRGRFKPASESAMGMGFDCGDGWFTLVWNLSQAIEDAAKLEGLDPNTPQWPEVMQVKSKFGELRFTLDEQSESIGLLVAQAVAQSNSICEECGAPGGPVTTGRRWMRTICPEHAMKYSKPTFRQ